MGVELINPSSVSSGLRLARFSRHCSLSPAAELAQWLLALQSHRLLKKQRSLQALYLAVVVLTNLKSDGPENVATEIAGFFYPVLKAVNGGNYPDAVSQLRTVSERKGYADAVAHYQAIKASSPRYYLSERHLTNWGYYELLIYHQLAKAEALFHLTAYLYPASSKAKEGLEDVRQAAGSTPQNPSPSK